MAKKISTVGVLTSGGDAPGMNAAIRAVTRTSSRAVPSAKVRINDRYVEGKTYLPEGKFTEKGTVTVAIYVDFLGTVSKTEISSATIQDEDVQYACREAALKTRFSLDVHAGHDNLLKGTILYEFK